MNNRIKIIAEIGVNHNGDLQLAFELIDAAAESGADFAKFQTFVANELASEAAEMAAYQKRALGHEGSQRKMLAALEFGLEEHERLVEHCQKRGIAFLSTAFDRPSLELLTQDLGQKILKVGSGDLNNGPLLYQTARTGCELIVSCGMASLGDIELALGLIALAFSDQPVERPTPEVMLQAWANPDNRARVREKVTLLHCVSNYPADPGDLNLNAMNTLRQAFDLPIGYSDHSQGITAPIVATTLGAVCIEKHLTLDRNLPGPDHAASVEPDEFSMMVSQINVAQQMLGGTVKVPAPSEWETAKVARKVVVARTAIWAGDEFGPENLGAKRAGVGVSPMLSWSLYGKKAQRSYAEGEAIGT